MTDLIIIGAGPGGYEAAIRAAQNGMSVTVFEERECGGTCLNRGCVPAKALLHAAETRREARKMGVLSDSPVDMAALQAWNQSVITQLRGGIETLLKQHKITLINGRAVIEDARRVSCNGEIYEAASILIAVGAKPALPPIEGIHGANILTSDEVLFSDTVYDRLLILGGGVIGVEMACAYAAFGSHVVIVEAMPRILPALDREISQKATLVLKKMGIDIKCGVRAERFTSGEGVSCALSDGSEIVSDAVLVAVGRKPNTEHLFAGNFSIDLNRGAVVVDERFRTNVPGVYAIGDVTGGIQLAHVASAQGVAFADLLAGKEASINPSIVPSCVYLTPEIACVGLTEQEAKERGISVKSGKFLMGGNARSLISSSEGAYVKVLCDAETEKIIGAQMMCERASDLIDEITCAIANGLTVHDLTRFMRPHPTFAEALTDALESVHGRAIHQPPRR